MEINIVARYKAIDLPLNNLKKELESLKDKISPLFDGGMLKSVLDEIAGHKKKDSILKLSEKTSEKCSGKDILEAINLVEEHYKLVN